MSVARRLLQRQRDRAELAVSLDLERQVAAHLGAVDAAFRVLDVVRPPAVHLADPVERPHPGPVRRAAAVDARHDEAAGIPPAEPPRDDLRDGLHAHARPCDPDAAAAPGPAQKPPPSPSARFARLRESAKRTPIEPPLFVKMNVLTPITSPSA